MADPRLGMEMRMLGASLARTRGTVALAVAAVAIGASVAAALLHVSGDVSRKLTRELRALGPDLLIAPVRGAGPGENATWLDERDVRARLARAGLAGAPLLYVVARRNGEPVQVVGADLETMRALHPGWRVRGDGAEAWVGSRLRARLGAVSPSLRLEPAESRGAPIVATRLGTLEAGGADDEAVWVPLAEAQTLAGRPGAVSLVQARIGDAAALPRVTAALETGGGVRVMPLHALSRTEAELLERMRHLMSLVTLAALLAAGLCVFGTLTDLALERRREIALLKALGASAAAITRQLAGEALAIGLAGGALGWIVGVGFAQIIGREVFHSSIALRAGVPLAVVALSAGVALIAGLGPIHVASRVEPAAVLKGD